MLTMKMITKEREDLGKVEKMMVLLTGSINLVGFVKHLVQDI